MAPPDAWEWSDAWVMAAVAAHGSQGCGLAELIAAADARNHAILTEHEISQGLGRLLAGGFVTCADFHFALTPIGPDLVRAAKGGLFGQVTSLHNLLARQPLKHAMWPVPPGVFDAACITYQRRAARWLRGRDRPS